MIVVYNKATGKYMRLTFTTSRKMEDHLYDEDDRFAHNFLTSEAAQKFIDENPSHPLAWKQIPEPKNPLVLAFVV